MCYFLFYFFPLCFLPLTVFLKGGKNGYRTQPLKIIQCYESRVLGFKVTAQNLEDFPFLSLQYLNSLRLWNNSAAVRSHGSSMCWRCAFICLIGIPHSVLTLGLISVFNSPFLAQDNKFCSSDQVPNIKTPQFWVKKSKLFSLTWSLELVPVKCYALQPWLSKAYKHMLNRDFFRLKFITCWSDLLESQSISSLQDYTLTEAYSLQHNSLCFVRWYYITHLLTKMTFTCKDDRFHSKLY